MAAKARHTSIVTPAMIRFLRPVFSIAATNFGFIPRADDSRSIDHWRIREHAQTEEPRTAGDRGRHRYLGHREARASIAAGTKLPKNFSASKISKAPQRVPSHAVAANESIPSVGNRTKGRALLRIEERREERLCGLLLPRSRSLPRSDLASSHWQFRKLTTEKTNRRKGAHLGRTK